MSFLDKLESKYSKNLKLKQNFLSSLVIFIIAIPLSIGIAMASGTSPTSALIAAIIGGLVVGIFSGAPLLVSGPAAGLSALVFQLVQQHGLEALPIIVVSAGIFQILFSALRAGKLFEYFPMSALEGMLAAIGIIILFGQFHVMLGQSVPSNVLSSIYTFSDSFLKMIKTNQYHILFLGIVGLMIQRFWGNIVPKLSWIPSALPAVIFVTIISLSFTLPRVELAPFGSESLIIFKQVLAGGWISNWPGLILAGFLMSIVASAETLLTARAVDQIALEKKHLKLQANLNKELFAQGLGNSISGLLGGLPLTGVIVRSAANVHAGATNRLSTIFHGLLVLLFISFLPWTLEYIPLTVLASVLVMTGIKLLNIGKLFSTFKQSKLDGSVWVATMVAIMVFGLLQGLVLGVTVHFACRFIRDQKSKFLSET